MAAERDAENIMENTSSFPIGPLPKKRSQLWLRISVHQSARPATFDRMNELIRTSHELSVFWTKFITHMRHDEGVYYLSNELLLNELE